MSTRGLYGFRKDGEDKLTYNHCDSYPEWLGRNILEFCSKYSRKEMEELFAKIVLVAKNCVPSTEQIAVCKAFDLYDGDVGTRDEKDWYCLLRNMQGNLEAVKKMADETGTAFMTNNNSFIYDSLFCEYAYIINLDSGVLELWRGFQKEQQEGSRYAGQPDRMGYYPCKLIGEIPLGTITNVEDVMPRMEGMYQRGDKE